MDVKNNQKTKETDIRKATKETVNSDRKPALFETSLSDQQGGVNYFELDKQIESMNRTTGKIFACKVCGKESSRKDIVRHIESLHISGVSHNCDFCDKVTRSGDAMRQHKRTHSLATAKKLSKVTSIHYQFTSVNTRSVSQEVSMVGNYWIGA